MENTYWLEIRAKNEKKYQERKDKERYEILAQMPGWKIALVFIFAYSLFVYDKGKELIKRILSNIAS